jgi:hypothetical protein
MEYRHLYSNEPRITLTSVLLLAVFVSAVAFIIWAIVWQPWNADDTIIIAPSNGGAVIVEEIAANDPDSDLDVLVQPATE